MSTEKAYKGFAVGARVEITSTPVGYSANYCGHRGTVIDIQRWQSEGRVVAVKMDGFRDLIARFAPDNLVLLYRTGRP